MKAGIDFGTSCTKLYLEDSLGRPTFLSYDNGDQEAGHIINVAMAAGIKTLHVTGIGTLNEFDRFEHRTLAGDRIENEILTHARGARYLLEKHGKKPPKSFLLVSIGTGTSYALVRGDAVLMRFLGNGIGGGTLAGLCRIADINLVSASSKKNGHVLDILIRDVLPESASTPTGTFVLSHIGKAMHTSPKEDLFASFVSLVANAVVRDVLMQRMSCSMDSNDIVIIGTPTEKCLRLRSMLTSRFHLCDLDPIFPPHAAYAGAAGAFVTEM